ncbi:MAG: EamA family transporter RarD [Ignavibacteria bacterium]|nr:EamA family transporter RarD [Ignavibacteria bacterium]
MNKGILAGLGAFFLWGLFPIYWKLLLIVPAYEILCHRIIWSLIFLVVIVAFTNRKEWIKIFQGDRKNRLIYILSSLTLSLNWFTFIWAVNSNYILEASLGYFLNPIINVLLGVLLLKEKLRFCQWCAVCIAFIAVLYLTIGYGSFPFIALTLAFSFAFYGYLKKIGNLNSVSSLTFETSVLFIPALIYLIFLEFNGAGSFVHSGVLISSLLALGGVVTTVPLLLFVMAARRLPLSTVGILQYIAPITQFLIGAFIYSEEVPASRLIGFILIWIALILYTSEGVIYKRKKLNNKRIIPGTVK